MYVCVFEDLQANCTFKSCAVWQAVRLVPRLICTHTCKQSKDGERLVNIST